VADATGSADASPLPESQPPAVTAIPPGRHAGIVSDQMTVVTDGSHLRLSGPIGFATADKDEDPEDGLTGELTGEISFRERRDGVRLTARFEIVIDGRTYTLWLEGRLEASTATGDDARRQFVGTYILEGASGLGLEYQGDASGTLVAGEESPAGEPAAPSSLRLTLGESPAPADGDAG
jgi:hypothetical protein